MVEGILRSLRRSCEGVMKAVSPNELKTLNGARREMRVNKGGGHEHKCSSEEG